MTNTTFVIGETLIGLRLDRMLTKKFPEFSRTYFQYLIESGMVLLNGHPIKKKEIPGSGDVITVSFKPTPETKVIPEEIPLSILYEDDYLIAINKPRGMVVHPGAGNPKNTLVNALLHHTKQLPQSSDELRPGIVHRLDKETSGVIIAAKTYEALNKLIDLFKTRQMEKQYLAICMNCPSQTMVNLPIGRHPVKRKEMCVIEGGKEAVTEFEIMAKNSQFSLVLAKPKTGRTHQIRVHLAHQKAPIMGDAVYGKKGGEKGPMLLHAYQLKFKHPFTNQELLLTSPPPEDFSGYVKKLSYKLENF